MEATEHFEMQTEKEEKQKYQELKRKKWKALGKRLLNETL